MICSQQSTSQHPVSVNFLKNFLSAYWSPAFTQSPTAKIRPHSYSPPSGWLDWYFDRLHWHVSSMFVDHWQVTIISLRHGVGTADDIWDRKLSVYVMCTVVYIISCQDFPTSQLSASGSASANFIHSSASNLSWWHINFNLIKSCEESLQLRISETATNTTAAGFHGCTSIITLV